MLLGIALHASLAFFPAFWAVQDSKVSQDGFYDELFHAVHGFRMPVFFLLSGFFTTMLWRRRGLGSLVRQRVTRVLIPLAIGAVTIVPLGDARVFGPDTSTGLIPDLHVLGYYAMFFAFGALMYSARGRDGAELADTVGCRWPLVLPATVVILLPVALYATFGDANSGPWAWGMATLLQATYTWAMIFGLMGLFRPVLSVERRGVRWLSDSAYWLYFAHLPLIIAGQAWIRDWHIPASLKFFGLCAISTLILLASYQLFVRYTPIGWLLNGRRTPTRFRLPRALASNGHPTPPLTADRASVRSARA